MLRKLLDFALACVIAAGIAAALVYWWAVQPI
jgi:hypothetical protein